MRLSERESFMNEKMFRLDGKVALVTGASYGIGFGIASAYAGMGATIVFNDINQEKVDMGEKAYADIGITAKGYVCDVTNEEQVKAIDLSAEEFAAAFYDVDNAFHHAIYRVASKESMLDLLENAFPYYQRYRYMTNLRDKADVSNLYRLHGELLDAFEAKDKKRLAEASRLHHFSGLNGLKKVMEKHPDYFIS